MNPVSEDRELARMLVDKCDSILEMYYSNIPDIVGDSSDDSPIDTTELMNTVETINKIRDLRECLVNGNTNVLFSRHKNALAIVLEMSLDMES